MAVTYESLMAIQHRNLAVTYTDKDTMLYALSVGMGAQPLDERMLPFVFEGRPMRTVPSMASVLMRAPVPESGLDFRRMLHGEQKLKLFREIPPYGSLTVDTGVTQVIDKGAEKGLVVIFESHARNAEGAAVFTASTVILARGDGGIGAPPGTLPAPHQIPQRAPDQSIRIDTRPDQALLYRLNEDRNPIHADPKFAEKAGFGRPILHGLCTYGLICGALVRDVCDGDSSRMKSFDLRFAAPVFPGETLELDVWLDDTQASFRCRAPQRDQVVVDNGCCELQKAPAAS
jgi:acyl dehydratase